MEIRCNAKLNLSFDIVGVRADGYHLVDTVMQSVDLCDFMTITPTDGSEIEIRSDNTSLPVGEGNLVYRAAKLLSDIYKVKNSGVSVYIKKRIPLRAGLGGGSANAAGALLALNKLWNLDIGDDELACLGLELGADVPFCLRGGTFRAKGIGEELISLPPFPECFFVIAMPGAGVSTECAYRQIDEKRDYARPDTERLISAICEGNTVAAAVRFCNVFETSGTNAASSEIIEKMRLLGAAGASMTGSGAAVFGLFMNEDDAANCCEKLKSDSLAYTAKPSMSGIITDSCQ